jgi:hypothetical protein
VDWHFCPHCETQLDAATFICPACRWDPLTPVDDAGGTDAALSLTERYRGSEYSSSPAATAAFEMRAPTSPTNRVRTIVIVGMVLLLGLYGSMLVFSDFQGHQEPAAALDPRR